MMLTVKVQVSEVSRYAYEGYNFEQRDEAEELYTPAHLLGNHHNTR